MLTWWSLLYNAILHSRADSLRSHVILHEWIAFYKKKLKYSSKWCTYSTGMACVTWNYCHLGAFCVHYTTTHHITSCKAIYVRCMCIAVTCHLHFWQNDWGLLRATAVTQGWNRYRNKSTESWPWRRRFSCSCRDSNRRPFSHESGTLTSELSPLPASWQCSSSYFYISFCLHVCRSDDFISLKKLISV